MKNILLHFLGAFLLFSCSKGMGLLNSDELSQGNYKEVRGFATGNKIGEPKPDQYPMYPGGLNGLMMDVSGLIKYPNEEVVNNIEGKVVVAYVIEKDGMLSNISIEKSVSPGLDEEAIRVVKKLKKWYPGFKDGKPVRVEFQQPFDFKLQ